MKILFDNLALGATLSALHLNANYPLSNLVHLGGIGVEPQEAQAGAYHSGKENGDLSGAFHVYYLKIRG